MEDNEEEDCDNNFPGHDGFGAFDGDTAMEKPKEEAVAEVDPTKQSWASVARCA
jgi:hypothetical protein